MKRIISAAMGTLVLMAMACSCSGIRTVKDDPIGTRIYTLDNGLQVYMSVNRKEPRIQTYIAVKVGSKNDPSETTGLAHYFEHLMFKGTEQFGTSDYAAEKPMLDRIESLFETYRQTTDEAGRAAIYHTIDSLSYEASKLAIPNEYDKLMAVIGADGTNAWTSSDETVYTEDIPSNQIENWARIQADRFRNTVIRGFHTELETIYEEKNMSLTQDSRKVWETLFAELFPSHPYGQQTTLGTQEHLKNPSITNVKKYHDTYYVPNNIRICVSGDFDPREMVRVIKKYWGDWEPNRDIPKLRFEPEKPITEPVSADVVGLEAEMVAMGWRFPGTTDDYKASAVAAIVEGVLSNGSAGLLDLDVNQQQKALGVGASNNPQPDYSSFIAMGRPKEGQSLEEVRDLLLEEFAKLRAGDFDEALVPATVNNIKLAYMRELEHNDARAQQYVVSFIGNIPWEDYSHQLDWISGVTKDDVVAFANRYLGSDNYAVVYKRQGTPTDIQKVSAPPITPIVTNRDLQSAFLKEIQSTAVKPVEPVFVDFSRDMSTFDYVPGVDVLYKKNTDNGIFDVSFTVNTGSEDNPALIMACDYLTYLGTPEKTAEQLASQMYSLACEFDVSVTPHTTTLSVSGLSENMEEAVAAAEDLIFNARGDEDILAALKADSFRAREDNKKSQRACYNALRNYITYGPEHVKKTNLSDSAISALTSDELLAALRGVFSNGHEISYYGPLSEQDLRTSLGRCHRVAEGAQALERRFNVLVPTPSSSVVMAQYDATQIYYYQYSNRGEKFDLSSAAGLALYNEYFGGGMNTVVFQEMREARGLAYSAWARLFDPYCTDGNYSYGAFIATQNDKMKTAVEAFAEIIDNMPCSEAAFAVAKDALVSRLRTQRVYGAAVLDAYQDCRDLGLDEPVEKTMFGELESMTLDDIVAVQQKWAKDRPYTYAILGDIKDLDVDFLRTLGPVSVVTLEDIFGY